MNQQTIREPEPFPAPAPVVSQGPVFDTTPIKQTVRRFTQADLERCAAWLIPLIQERWNGPSITVVNGWLRMWMSDNEFNIACTDNAVSLAMIDREPMDPRNIIREVFTFSNPGYLDDEILIYQHFMRWGKSLRAIRLEFDKLEGNRKEVLKKVLPGFKWRSIGHVEL